MRAIHTCSPVKRYVNAMICSKMGGSASVLSFAWLNGYIQLLGRIPIGLGFKIHGARFDRGEQLTCGMKIQRGIGQVVHADGERCGEQKEKRDDPH